MDNRPRTEIVPDAFFFCAEAKELFQLLLTEFHYKIIEEINQANYTKITYRNLWRRRKVVIENQTHGVDYGFSFFVYKLWSKEMRSFCNVPWEKQDVKCRFLKKEKENIFNNKQLVDIIKGKQWKTIRRVVY